MRAALLAAAGAAGVALAVAAAGCGSDAEPRAAATASTPAQTAPAETTPTTPATTTPSAPDPQQQAGLRPPLAFHLRRRAQLRSRPAGRVVGTLHTKTEFKSPRILAVTARKPGWVLVRTTSKKNHVGWLPTASGKLFSQPRTIIIDLSARRLTLLHRGRVTNRYRVAVGTPATPTPVGKFAVTDRLKVRPGTPYGCCILALNGHQPKIAQGWGGGDRIAIHATPDESAIGKAVSHGCVRATNKALRQLMRRVRLGTPVRIKA
jgi:lipoprotein-anchoring transpeptidase ErfK/SrfK